jgi:microcin C transport system substrate-binding protein
VIRTLALALVSTFLSVAGAAAQDAPERHALSLMGEVKYPAGFAHFDYVNPNAPKAGVVRFGSQGTFDNFNIFVAGIKGEIEDGIGRLYDTLMTTSYDEVGTAYGLIAESVRHPADYSSVTYRLRPEARFHDGKPITSQRESARSPSASPRRATANCRRS